MPLMDTIDLLPVDVSIGDLGHDAHHDLIHVGLKDLKTVLTTLSGSTVTLSTPQSITGIKTFTVSPIVPTPTTAGQAAPKSYIDNIATGKSNTGHTHTIANITGLQAILDDKAVDSDLVHVVNNETIGGIKTFTSAPRLTTTSSPGYSWVASDSIGNGGWVALSALAEDGTVPWANVLGKPATFPPEAHTHTISDISGLASRAINAGTGLLNGGNLSADITLSVNFGNAAGTVTQGNDSRLSNTRTPTDGSTTTIKIADGNVTIPKLATSARPYDIPFVQTLGVRATGAGEIVDGIRIPRAITFTEIVYRLGTADASGTTTIELRKNGAAVSGTSASINAPSLTSLISGSFSFAQGDILTVHITAVGTTPGKRLTADISGYLT